MRQNIADKLAALPDTPGVYLMKNAAGEVIYVGKAQSLRDRVRSYFSGSDTRSFVALLDTMLADLEVVLTHTNKEAMLLENELIKAHKPRFNIKLTDDKRFLCLRLDIRKPYPRLQVVRRFAKDGARYFGPYHSASAIREALRMINRHFQLRTCTDQVLNNRTRPCLQYQIKRCPAPCVYDLSQGEYQTNVRDVTAFLEGRQSELVESLQARMHSHADAMEFEAAGALRDQIKAVSRSLERQRMITPDFVQRDVVGIYREGPTIELHVMRTRQGRLVDARRYSFEDTELPTSEVLADFAGRYYTDTQESLPDEILFPLAMQWSEPLAQVLAERSKRTVACLAPQRGDKLRLVELACRNAHQAFMDKRREAGAAKTALERLKRALHLKRLPNTIECMDISHMQGSQIVASVVHFEAGAPKKERYRHYKIRSTEGQDDFKSMYEVISRRVRRGLEQDDLPDLMVIDGGKGQLGAAAAALKDHGVGPETVDVIGLAKSRKLDEEDSRTKLTESARPWSRDAHTQTAKKSSSAGPRVDLGLSEAEHADTFDSAKTHSGIDADADADADDDGDIETDTGVENETTADIDSDAADDIDEQTDWDELTPEADLGESGDETKKTSSSGAGDKTDLDTAISTNAVTSPHAGTAPRSPERVFVLNHKNPIVLRQNSAELFLLVRARDEAHRFAITFHRKLRGKAQTRSALDSVPGVGPKRRRELLKAFGSVARVRQASEADLAGVVGPKLAAQLVVALRHPHATPPLPAKET